MSTKTTAAASAESDDGYSALERQTADRVAGFSGSVFTTDVEPLALWNAYLEGLPADRRKHYECHCCRRFVERFGGLVQIMPGGNTRPLAWDAKATPDFFADSVGRMERLLDRARVNGVFVWDGKKDATWGVPQTGVWSHLSGAPTAKPVTRPLKKAHEVAAEFREDYGVLRRGMAEFGPEVANQAVRVLEQGDLYRNEKAAAVVRWFAELHSRVGDVKNPRLADNLVWLAVAAAPPGFAHVKNTVAGTLMEDINAGLGFDDISRRWKDKLHPLQYQRPTAAPTAGNIARAEKLFEELGLAPALKRRFATLDDVLAFEWRPAPPPEAPAASGVFGHLTPKGAKAEPPAVELPAQTMTWEKFKRTVLPSVRRMELRAPAKGGFCGVTTAEDPTAPALFQWDGLSGRPRNPVGWYVYTGGSAAENWKLTPHQFVAVTGIFRCPAHWQEPDKFKHHAERVQFALAGAQDRTRAGLAIFPECLRNEVREVRSAVEAFSNAGVISGEEAANANGMMFSGKNAVELRVHTDGGVAHYVIDRMD